ncbi:MAG: hypothetical protein HY719_10990 [Planctomycetes bacterium]|nr:hypothetical protein [Planctomycetota bacterium]
MIRLIRPLPALFLAIALQAHAFAQQPAPAGTMPPAPVSGEANPSLAFNPPVVDLGRIDLAASGDLRRRVVVYNTGGGVLQLIDVRCTAKDVMAAGWVQWTSPDNRPVYDLYVTVRPALARPGPFNEFVMVASNAGVRGLQVRGEFAGAPPRVALPVYYLSKDAPTEQLRVLVEARLAGAPYAADWRWLGDERAYQEFQTLDGAFATRSPPGAGAIMFAGSARAYTPEAMLQLADALRQGQAAQPPAGGGAGGQQPAAPLKWVLYFVRNDANLQLVQKYCETLQARYAAVVPAQSVQFFGRDLADPATRAEAATIVKAPTLDPSIDMVGLFIDQAGKQFGFQGSQNVFAAIDNVYAGLARALSQAQPQAQAQPQPQTSQSPNYASRVDDVRVGGVPAAGPAAAIDTSKPAGVGESTTVWLALMLVALLALFAGIVWHVLRRASAVA